MHHDESINGWFVTQIWQTGIYRYDPSNYHGPLFYYLLQVSEALGGWGIESFRFLTVSFSVLTFIWLLRWSKNRFSLSGWWLFGLMLSPGYLFFSRSGIHETVLVFFVVMATTAWIDVWCLRRPQSFSTFLYGLTGAALLKETFIIPMALGLVVSLPLILKKEKWQILSSRRTEILGHLGICSFIWVYFYSSFGRNPEGLLDFFRAFLPWAKTGTGPSGHEKEFAYFLKLIWNYEFGTTAALVVVISGVFKKGWSRGLCLWALGVLLAYSLIPYKTPWCLPSIQLPLWIAAGAVIAQSSFLIRLGAQLIFLALAICNFSAWYTLNFTPLPREPHPYVYVQTTIESKIFVDSLLKQAQDRPEIRLAQIQWASFEPWPFPWWLGSFPNQSSLSYEKGLLPNMDLVLIDAKNASDLETKLNGEFWKFPLSVRDAREPAIAYLKKSIFKCPAESCQEFRP